MMLGVVAVAGKNFPGYNYKYEYTFQGGGSVYQT